jgi:hypothetical protein
MRHTLFFIALAAVLVGVAQAEAVKRPMFNMEPLGTNVRIDEFGCFGELVDLHAEYPAAVDIATRLYRKNACDTLYILQQWRKRTVKLD